MPHSQTYTNSTARLEVDKTRVSTTVSPSFSFSSLLLCLPPHPLSLLPLPYLLPYLLLFPPHLILPLSFLYLLLSPYSFLLLLYSSPTTSFLFFYSYLLLSCLCLAPTRSPLHPCLGSPHQEQSQPEGCKTTTLRRTQKTLSSEPMAL